LLLLASPAFALKALSWSIADCPAACAANNATTIGSVDAMIRLVNEKAWTRFGSESA
jgi:hypothetical protein